jgi:hypothetical protein
MAASMQQLAQPDAAAQITDVIRAMVGECVGSIRLAA